MTGHILIYADLDSQLFSARGIAAAFCSHGWHVVFNIPIEEQIPSQLLSEIQKKYDVLNFSAQQLALDRLLIEFDAVVVLTTGSRIAQFRRDVELSGCIRGRRPLLITGFNGIVYEKFEEGLCWRLGYDLIYLNSRADLESARRFLANTRFAEQPFVIIGLQRGNNAAPPSRSVGDTRKIVFAEQVNVPNEIGERRWLFRQLGSLARVNPDWEIVIKPRVRPGETTFFKPLLPPEDVCPMGIPNLKIDYRTLNQQLRSARILLTVSSTAVFDAFEIGITPLVVADFGVRNNYGTHFFWGSGLEVFLQDEPDLDTLAHTTPDPAWLATVGGGAAHTVDALVNAVADAKKRPKVCGSNPYDGRPLPVPGRFNDVASSDNVKQTAIPRSSSFDAQMRAGERHMAEAKYGQAVQAYRRAVDANPHSTKAMRALTDAQVAAGDRCAAAETLKQLLQMMPEDQRLQGRKRWLEALSRRIGTFIFQPFCRW